MFFFKIIFDYLLSVFIEILHIFCRFFSFKTAQNPLRFSKFVSFRKKFLAKNFILENVFLTRLGFFLFGVSGDPENFLRLQYPTLQNDLANNVKSSGVYIKHNVITQIESKSTANTLNMSFQGHKSTTHYLYGEKRTSFGLKNKQDLDFFHRRAKPFSYVATDSLLAYSDDVHGDFLRYLKLFEKSNGKKRRNVLNKNSSFKEKSNTKKSSGELKQNSKNKGFPIKHGLKVLPRLRVSRDADAANLTLTDLPNYYNVPPPPVGPYGSDTVLYNKDLYAKDRKALGRRMGSFDNKTSVKNLEDFSTKVGFLNSSLYVSEDEENDISVPLTSDFPGRFYVVNPLLVLGFLLYAFLELFVLIFFFPRLPVRR